MQAENNSGPTKINWFYFGPVWDSKNENPQFILKFRNYPRLKMSPTGKTSLIPKRESSLYTIARSPRSAAQEKQGVWQSETLSLRLCIPIEHYEDEGRMSFRFCFLCFQLQLVDLSQGFLFWLFRSCDFGLTPLCDALIWKSEHVNLWVLDQEANFLFFFLAYEVYGWVNYVRISMVRVLAWYP